MVLSGHISRIDDVSQRDREQMFALMQRYYENVSRDEFESDFSEKDWVIVARGSENDCVYGFSTQTLYSQRVGDETVRVLFSGDTIMDQSVRANSPLARMWGRLALTLIDTHPSEHLYWFLISKGYRTYRFLPVFFCEFYPRFDQPTPHWAERLIFEFASTRFGTRFCESTGILRAREDACRLRKTVAEVTTNRLKNPHIAFFDRMNPNHGRGDELCCLAQLSRENLNRSAFHVIGTTPDNQSMPPLDLHSTPVERASH